MARIEFCDIFLRLPPATAILVLSAAFGICNGHALPRQTKTVAFHELDVVPFPPAPTDAPFSPFELLRRQENTICGYLGGNSNLPATCSAGSHCVLDNFNGVVGCCPNGGSCTTGVFTACVDGNSDPQTEINPYVYTCQGGANVCYKNQFAGGYYQYGCGTASEQGTTVQTSANGATTGLSLEETILSPSATPITLSTPTTIGSRSSTTSDATSTISPSSSSSSSTSTTRSSTSSSTDSTSSTSSGSSTSAESATDSATPTPAAPEGQQGTSYDRTGAIVGGTIGGAAALVAIIAVIAFCLGKRRKSRQAPGPAPVVAPTTEYSDPIRSHGAAFAPLPSWQEGQQQQKQPPPQQQQQPPQHYSLPSTAYNSYAPSSYYDDDDDYDDDDYSNGGRAWGGPGAAITSNNNNISSNRQSPPSLRYDPVHVAGLGTGLAPVAEEQHSDQEPGPREIDEFSRAYSGAGIGTGIGGLRGGRDDDDDDEEDTRPLRQYDVQVPSSSAPIAAGAARGGGGGGGGGTMTDVDVTPPSEPEEEDTSSRTYSRGGSGYRPLWQQNRRQQQSRDPAWF